MTDIVRTGHHWRFGAGFTLVEVLVVLLIVGLAGTLVSLSVGMNPATVLEDEGDRLRQVLEAGFERSRLTRARVVWLASQDGYSLNLRDGANETRASRRDLGSPVRILAVWQEGVLLAPPWELALSGRNPGLFRVRLGTEQGAHLDLRSNLLGRVDRVRDE